jgi:uncharacterized membrane protein
MLSWKRFGVSVVSFMMLLLTSVAVSGQSADGRVYAVLFYSPTCSHCHEVINEDLPPLQERFGDDLMVFLIDVTSDYGQAMVQSAYAYYDIQSTGVPMMIIDEQILIGSVQIPQELPAIIETGLANGGIDIPQFPLMVSAFEEWQAQSGSAELGRGMSTFAESSTSPLLILLEQEPIASAMTLAILVALIVSLATVVMTRQGGLPVYVPQRMLMLTTVFVAVLTMSILSSTETDWFALGVIAVTFVGFVAATAVVILRQRVKLAVVIMSVVGLAISAYMAYVETTASSAVCGAIGDCNAVQQSSYAFILGIPIGVIGLLGYLLMLGLGLMLILSPVSFQSRLVQVFQVIVAFSGLFTIYLTFLEPFVIGAVCAWCLLSALLVINLMWLVLPTIKLKRRKTIEYLAYQA